MGKREGTLESVFHLDRADEALMRTDQHPESQVPFPHLIFIQIHFMDSHLGIVHVHLTEVEQTYRNLFMAEF